MRGTQQAIKMSFRTTRTYDHQGEKPLIWRRDHSLTKQTTGTHQTAARAAKMKPISDLKFQLKWWTILFLL